MTEPLPALPILVCDDQPDVRQALALLLKTEGMAALSCDHPDAALEAARTREFGVALIDLNYTRDTTSGAEGLALLERLQALDPTLPVVVMTAWGNVDLAVRAIKAGASDFVEKPWDNARLMSIVRTQLRLRASARGSSRLQAENALLRGIQDGELIAHSASMQRLLEVVARVAPTQANVLLLGENGTGKGVLAQLLHRNSKRAAAAFVKVNMGGIAESVFEAEMFGHTKGAFTDAKAERIGRFEVADGGTLFLDEIGNIPLAQQPKLLRVLEDGEFERLGSSRTMKVDVRLISATNADLQADIARGAFRRDLLFRLNTVELLLPPLRERSADIVPMARSFLQRLGARYGRTELRLGNLAEAQLLRYAWPGNVRELSHVIERAVLLSSGSCIDTLQLSGELAAGNQSTAHAAHSEPPKTLDGMEEHMIRRALMQAEGNIQRAADALGLSRQALYRRLQKFGIDQ